MERYFQKSDSSTVSPPFFHRHDHYFSLLARYGLEGLGEVVPLFLYSQIETGQHTRRFTGCDGSSHEEFFLFFYGAVTTLPCFGEAYSASTRRFILEEIYDYDVGLEALGIQWLGLHTNCSTRHKQHQVVAMILRRDFLSHLQQYQLCHNRVR